ncbi:S8 family peptidase [Piscinibacter terrae]|uniref:Peptidase S8 n=1 Tax=Piscinibacter terrae TaxID=2496871 RepID=A0A3N7HPK7_9BURK|nr:S8 family peptidase [Albitalea terrae]RQP24148.1 peptidase S8 [Albitalea terrae]
MNRNVERRGFTAIAFGVLSLALLGPQAASAGGSAFSAAAAPSALSGTPQSHPTDRIIIKYRSGLMGVAASSTTGQRATLHQTAQDVGLRAGVQMKLLRVGGFDTHIMKLDRRLAHADVERIAREIKASDPNVEYAEADRILKPMFVPNDTQYGQQWQYFESTGGLNLPAAWDKSTGSGVVVAVIDTGYRPHADLAANILPGYDMINDAATANDGNGRDSDAKDPGDAVAAGECGSGEPAEDSSWHGTHVAGTIAAVTNNGSGVAGVAFNAKVLPVRVLGKCGGYTSDIADGMIWASGGTVSGLPSNPNPARVINMSLGGSGSCDTTSQNAINSARSRGTVVVVAAGNSNANASGFSPASCSGVITVAATNRSGGRAYYSNYGSIVAVAAPGGDVRSSETNGILSTLNAGTTSPGADSYAYYQGTSMATPHVAGVVALMLSKNPSLTPDDVATRLKGSTRAFPATCSQCGTGIVDASAAVDAAGGIVVPPGNEVEPNNSTSTAQAVTKPVTINGTMSSSSDVDYFKLTVPAGGSLTATLTPNSTSDYDLYIYKGSTQVASSEKGTGAVDSASTTNTGSSSATYYVRVLYYAGKTGSTGTYTLKLQ